jgi:hypothetical protein
VAKSRIAVHVVTVIVAISQVRIAMLGRRPPPDIGIRQVQVVVMERECKKMRGEKWRHLLHSGDAADVPVADLLVKGRRISEHLTVRRHAAHGMSKGGGRKEGHSVRSQYTAVMCGSGSTSEWVMC